MTERPRYVLRELVIKYLETYAETFGMRPRGRPHERGD
jgi:hypothetical protein